MPGKAKQSIFRTADCFVASAPRNGKGRMNSDPRLASMSPEELRSHMRALGYRTQNDLANAIGVSRSAVSLWLEGKVGVPRPVAMLLRMLLAAQRRSF
jgi:DNA-binding XRE family transcriptional regulator